MKTKHWFLATILSLLLAGCGPDLPFEAEYTSKDRVVITYQGKKYVLERYGIPAQTPFRYRFEQDGDLDLTINGQEYEVDSPYDRDKKTVKKKKKKSKKKPAKKSKKR